MSEDKGYVEQEEIYSQTMRAGRRTYFFDVRETKAGDYYLTITESKKFSNDDGSFHFKKHKVYLYKEDFAEFNDSLNRATDFILKEKGGEVISERHQKDYVKPASEASDVAPDSIDDAAPESFSDVDFDDI